MCGWRFFLGHLTVGDDMPKTALLACGMGLSAALLRSFAGRMAACLLPLSTCGQRFSFRCLCIGLLIVHFNN